MSTTLQFRRGNSAAAAAVTGADGEIYINTQTKTVHVHDGVTAGGFALANASSVAAKANAFINVVETSGGNVSIGNTVTGCSFITVNGTQFTVNTSYGLSVTGGINASGVAGLYGGAVAYENVYLQGNTYVTYNGGSGALFLDGKVYANGSLGLSGQVLKTNGSGYTYWGNTSTVSLASVAEDVLPSFNDVFDLGSSSKRWNDVFLTGTVNVNGATLTGNTVTAAGQPDTYNISTPANFVSNAAVVSRTALVGDLLFTNNMITPSSTASQYSGTANTLLINGRVTITKGVAYTPSTLATTGTVDVDFNGNAVLTQGPLTGVVTYTGSSYTAGSSVTIRVTNGSTERSLSFPTNWVFVGTKPSTIAANKVGILTVTSFGTTEADCVAAWAVMG